MTIAGSDSGGAAGVQADLKTFAAFGVYGTSAITAITAQNTKGVTKVQQLPVEMVEAQIDAIVDDIGADAVKTGMLASAAIVKAVAVRIKAHGFTAVVVDPMMFATSGDRMLLEEAVVAYKSDLFPVATVVTPNIPEAEAFTGIKIKNVMGMKAAAKLINRMGAKNVLVMGGHLEGEEVVDVLFDGTQYMDFSGERIHTTNTHGTGCTLSSAIASGLAHGRPLDESVAVAKLYVTEALRSAFPMGQGHGPLNHLYAWWSAGGSRGYGG